MGVAMNARALMVLILLSCSGCKHVAEKMLAEMAVAVLAATVATIAEGVAEDLKNGRRDHPSTGSDVKLRMRCTRGRSYKLRCPPAEACFYENSEGGAYSCAEPRCAEVPSALLQWCSDL
jgi:hypothetical protein